MCLLFCVQLHAPWCQHSKAALAEFQHTVQYIVDNRVIGVVVGKIDIIKHNGTVIIMLGFVIVLFLVINFV